MSLELDVSVNAYDLSIREAQSKEGTQTLRPAWVAQQDFISCLNKKSGVTGIKIVSKFQRLLKEFE